MQKRSRQDQVETHVDVEDVDDVIGVAARMKDADQDRLTVEEVEEVALELDIEPEYVGRAVEALEARRAEQERREEAERAGRRLRRGVAVAAAVALVVGLLGASLLGQSGLSERQSVADQKRAQVVNVIERRRQVQATLKGQPMTPDREAERIGSENRVRVEQRRYDEAAARYNAYASSIPGMLACALFGRPSQLPLSNEIDTW